jgi:copper chaperone CopZ
MALKSVSTAELRRELARREKGARKLSVRRAALARKLAALDAELSDLGHVAGKRRGRPPGRGKGKARGKAGGKRGGAGRKRARNAVSLPEVIAKVVKVGSTVAPAEIVGKVRKAGYKSTAAHFGMMVSNALSKDPRFKRVSRGQYQRMK